MTQDEYIVNNRNRRVEDVALELSRRKDLDAPFVLRQIEGWQRMRTKVPRWTEVEGIHFPPRLALEQCSGQPAAEYKAKNIERLLRSDAQPAAPFNIPDSSARTSCVDLTGGMGVDFSFIAPLFDMRTYVEQREELVEAARHNFPLLRLADADIIHGDGVAYLESMTPVDLIFLDPARRDAHGGKTVLIEDCEPNVAALLPLLRTKARLIMVKLSPMLDLHRAIRSLHDVATDCVKEVHIFSSGGECKDLLLIIEGEKNTRNENNTNNKNNTSGENNEAISEPIIYCADEHHSLSYTTTEEAEAICKMAGTISGYLYEPGPSIMKAGAYKTTAARYALDKLHANSHLYVADTLKEDFPGRVFAIDRVYSFAKADLKALAADLKLADGKANLTIRNFPASVAELRKKLKMKEGGPVYLFATTDADDRKVILRCSKVQQDSEKRDE